MSLFFSILPLLLTAILSSEELERLFKESVDIIPEPSKFTFSLNYSNFFIHFSNIRFFKPIIDGMTVSSLEDSLEAKNLLLTAVSDIRLDLRKSFYYPDFLLEFNISNYTLIKSAESSLFTVSTLTLSEMFISNAHDLGASSYFKSFKDDSERILGAFNELLMIKFNNVIRGYYLLDELAEILRMVQTQLTEFKFLLKCDDLLYRFISINGFIITSYEKPPQAELLFDSKENFTITFTVDNLSTGSVRYDKMHIIYRMKYSINERFIIDLMSLNVLPICIKSAFLTLMQKTFKEKEKEYYKDKQGNAHKPLVCFNNYSAYFDKHYSVE